MDWAKVIERLRKTADEYEEAAGGEIKDEDFEAAKGSLALWSTAILLADALEAGLGDNSEGS